MTDAADVTRAYDAAAADYDRHLARDSWMRRILWRHYDRVFQPGDRIMDAGCGTGLDSLHLASRGVRVTAVDVSGGMLDRLRAKLASAPGAELVDVRPGDISDVAGAEAQPFDGMISSFGPLNTADLERFGQVAARAIRPGGRLVCHMLSPGYLAAGWRGGLERLGLVPPRGRARASLEVAGTHVRHSVLTAEEVFPRFFSEGFVLRHSYALGFLVLRKMETVLPELVLDTLGALEARVGGFLPSRSMGRFFVLDLERRPHVADAPRP
jgi:SAM-dependent methyltransferase